MTAFVLPNPKQQYFQNGGTLPLVGGKVYTYAVGSSTPKATYSDSTALVPNSNPIILDSRGEAKIYWDGFYRIEVRDASNSLIYAVDNVGLSDGTIDGVPIGSTTRSTGAFTTVAVTDTLTTGGNATLGNASTDAHVFIGSVLISNGLSVTTGASALQAISGISLAISGASALQAVTATTVTATTVTATTVVASGNIGGPRLLTTTTGSAAAPAIVVGAGSNGFIAGVTNGVSAVTNGVERNRIDSTGEVSRVIPGGSTLFPDYACRAWANINGASGASPVIRKSGGIATAVRNGVGVYSFTLSTALPDSQYAVVASVNVSGGSLASSNSGVAYPLPISSTQVDVYSSNNDTDNAFDVAFLYVAIFR